MKFDIHRVRVHEMQALLREKLFMRQLISSFGSSIVSSFYMVIMICEDDIMCSYRHHADFYHHFCTKGEGQKKDEPRSSSKSSVKITS
jgi:hypothetical protein